MAGNDTIGAAIHNADARYEAYKAAADMAVSSSPNPIYAAAADATGMATAVQEQLQHKEQYRHNTGWVNVAIKRIGTRVAGLGVRMGRRLTASQARLAKACGRRVMSKFEAKSVPMWHRSAGYGQYEEIESHRWLDAIHRPNWLFCSSYSLIMATVANICLTGKGYWWTPRINGRLELWPMPSTWVSLINTDEGVPHHYDVQPISYGSDPIEVPLDEMVAILDHDPANPRETISPAQTQSPAIATDEQIQMTKLRHFTNGFFPGWGLTIGRHPDLDGTPGQRPILTREQRQEVIDVLRVAYEGAVNANEPIILDGLIENVVKLTSSVEEMGYIESGKETKSRILQAYAVNPIIMGEIENANRAQAAVADQIFIDNVINPLVTMICQPVTVAINEPGVALWLEEAKPNDADLTLKQFAVARKNGDATADEFREHVLGLPPMEDEDEPEEPPEDGADEDEPDEGPTGTRRKSRPMARKSAPRRRGKPSKAFLAKVGTVFGKQADGVEMAAEARITAFFRRVGREAGEEVISLAASSPASFTSPENAVTIAGEIFRPVEWVDQWRELGVGVLTEAAVTGYHQAKAMIDARLDDMEKQATLTEEEIQAVYDFELPPVVTASISDAVAEVLAQPYWNKILETVGDDVAEVLKTGIDEQWNRYKLSKEIGETVGSRARGKLIAETEMTGAMNAGHEAQLEELYQQNLTPIKIWVTVGDTLVRVEHQDMANVEATGKPALFLVDGQFEVPYPGHYSLPARLRCRCRCTYFTDLAELRV